MTVDGKCYCSQHPDSIYDPAATVSAYFSTFMVVQVRVQLGARVTYTRPYCLPPDFPQTYKAIVVPESTVVFYKPGGANWTLPAYIDKISDSVWLTRQSQGSVYNYKWYLDTYGRDATSGELVRGPILIGKGHCQTKT